MVSTREEMSPHQTVVLVTGSSRGIGRALAHHLAQQGYRLVLHYKTSKEAALAVEDTIIRRGGTACTIQADVSQEKDAERLIEHCISEYGQLHILINCVGPYLYKSILETSPQEWDELIRGNLYSSYYCCHYAIPHLKKAGWGRILNFAFAGVSYLKTEPYRTPYRIAKTGILLLSRSLATVLAPNHITVNVLAPGIVDNGNYSEEYVDRITPEIPAGRIGLPEDVYQVVDFLINPDHTYLTGICIEIAGGWHL
jgi:3-oxoacyl-[acyl-carrier protein] reductase